MDDEKVVAAPKNMNGKVASVITAEPFPFSFGVKQCSAPMIHAPLLAKF